MSDLKDALERLRKDVSGLRLAPAAAVRRNSDRRRRATWAAVPAATALVAAAVLVPAALLSGSDGGSKPPVSVAPATSGPSRAWSPPPDQPWLPRPWRVDSAQRTTLAAAGAAGDDFCGIAEAIAESEGEVPAVRQGLSDGAKVVRVYAIATPSFEQAADLFKRLYSECGAHGPVASEGGPAMYWQAAAGTPSAALWDDTTVYLVASGPPAKGVSRPDLRAVVAGLIDTVGERCDGSRTGTCFGRWP